MLDDAEIEQLGAMWRKQDVSGLQIAVDDAKFVKGLQSGENFESNLGGFARGKRTLAEPLGQRFAFDKFHDQHELAGFFSDVVKAAGVGVGDLSGGARFLPKALALGGIVGARADKLKSDGAVETLVLGF